MAAISENTGDASANTGTTYTISLGDVFQGTLDPAADKDWVKVELSAGTIYDFTLSGVDSADFALFDSSGNHVVSGGIIPSGGKLIFSPTATGTYYIYVGSTDSDHSGEYELSLVENTIPEGTYDEIADYLTDGFSEWEGATRLAFEVESGSVLTANITALTEDGQQLAKWALEAWTSVTGIQFEFVDHDNAHITFDDNEDGGFTLPAAVDGIIISSHVNVSADWLIIYGKTMDSFTFSTYIHEIGHALGLGHPGPYNDEVVTYGVKNIFLNDSYQASVMSYIPQTQNTYINASFANHVTPMIADIIAIQNLYGIPTDINVGDTVYGYQSNVDGYLGQFFKLWTGETPFSNIDMVAGTGTPTIKLRLADLDGDGDSDLVIGNDSGSLFYFENSGTSINANFAERTGSDNPFESVSVDNYSTPTFTDLDADGDLDLTVGNSEGDIAYYENTGTVTGPSYTQRTGTANPFDNITMGSWSTLALADLDGDGDPDLAVGNDGGDIHYYENTGTSANPNFTPRTGETNPLNNINAGSYSIPVFVDLDDDNDSDLVVGNGSGTIFYFENTGTVDSAAFTERSGADNPLFGIS